MFVCFCVFAELHYQSIIICLLPLSILELLCFVFHCVCFTFLMRNNEKSWIFNIQSQLTHTYSVVVLTICVYFSLNSCTFSITLYFASRFTKGGLLASSCNHYQQLYKFYKICSATLSRPSSHA